MNDINRINDINDENIEDLDDSWIQEFEKIDNDYKNYYMEDLSFIKIHCIYVNNHNEIEKITENKTLLQQPGFLQREELLSIIKHNSFSNQCKYSLLSILKFNLNLEPIHLKTFLRNKNPNIGTPFLQSVKNLDNIKFEKSITMFHDINELLIIFHQKTNLCLAKHQSTKKVFIHANFKRTKKRI